MCGFYCTEHFNHCQAYMPAERYCRASNTDDGKVISSDRRIVDPFYKLEIHDSSGVRFLMVICHQIMETLGICSDCAHLPWDCRVYELSGAVYQIKFQRLNWRTNPTRTLTGQWQQSGTGNGRQFINKNDLRSYSKTVLERNYQRWVRAPDQQERRPPQWGSSHPSGHPTQRLPREPAVQPPQPTPESESVHPDLIGVGSQFYGQPSQGSALPMDNQQPDHMLQSVPQEPAISSYVQQAYEFPYFDQESTIAPPQQPTEVLHTPERLYDEFTQVQAANHGLRSQMGQTESTASLLGTQLRACQAEIDDEEYTTGTKRPHAAASAVKIPAKRSRSSSETVIRAPSLSPASSGTVAGDPAVKKPTVTSPDSESDAPTGIIVFHKDLGIIDSSFLPPASVTREVPLGIATASQPKQVTAQSDLDFDYTAALLLADPSASWDMVASPADVPSGAFDMLIQEWEFGQLSVLTDEANVAESGPGVSQSTAQIGPGQKNTATFQYPTPPPSQGPAAAPGDFMNEIFDFDAASG